jgi:tRNA-dihydrouridine synthase
MCNTDYSQDEQFRQMLEQFLNRLITVHGRSREETRFSKAELQRAYDAQKKLRRSNFTFIHGNEPD